MTGWVAFGKTDAPWKWLLLLMPVLQSFVFAPKLYMYLLRQRSKFYKQKVG